MMPDPAREEHLAELIADLVEQGRTGQSPDIELVARQYPELAADLRELWTTAMIAEDVASYSDLLDGPDHATQDGSVENSPAALDIPLSARGFGDYELLEELGRGGMGVVYKARQISLGRTVALKMILRGELASLPDVVRFRAEAASAAHLDHPHIVPVYEVGEHEGQPYFSMKYVSGTTLALKLAEGPLSAQEAASLLLPVCRAIAEAHRRGVLHRDLKPSNILIDQDGQPHITDFGLAKRIAPPPSRTREAVGGTPSTPPLVTGREMDSSPYQEGGGGVDARTLDYLTQTGAILGTPSYMAPEQAAGQRGVIGPASDVYSLGTILYQCLTGRPPFQAASPVDVLLMVLEQDPLPPRLLNPKADPDLEMIALKCLQKPAELRYQSADALADDLAAWLASEPISARSTNIGQLLSRMLRETHHAGVLENWGLLWMWHSLVLLVLCVTTNGFQWAGITSRLPYLSLWVFGLGAWAGIFWTLRRRSGPITFVERQIAHVWGASMIASSLLFWVETLLGVSVLTLSPVLALIGAMVFVIKAGILSGTFYLQAAILFGTGVLMAWMRYAGLPDFGLTLYGVVTALCFFIPGLKYYRQRAQAARRSSL